MVFIEFILMDTIYLYFIRVLILTLFLHLGQKSRFNKVGAQYEVELGHKPIRHAICETHKISIPGPWRWKLSINKLLLSPVCLCVFRIIITEDKRLDGRRLHIKQLSTDDLFGEEQAWTIQSLV